MWDKPYKITNFQLSSDLQNEDNCVAQTEPQPPTLQPLFQPVVASAASQTTDGSTTVIVPTGPQIIQVPVVTSNLQPQAPASFIILQPAPFPMVPAMQQGQQALYLPTNGMMHLNYATTSQPPPAAASMPTFQPQFTTILPTYICTQDAMAASTGASTQPQLTAPSVNFSWPNTKPKSTENTDLKWKTFFFVYLGIL